MAFQIIDDILGIWGDERETGKPLGNDIRRRKKSFPVVFALENAGGKLGHQLSEAYRNRTPDRDDVNEVMGILEEVGAQKEARKVAEEYCNKARALIGEGAVAPSVKQDFNDLFQFLLERTY
jgi:geranylgeranyl diphosphate synthase, type I